MKTIFKTFVLTLLLSQILNCKKTDDKDKEPVTARGMWVWNFSEVLSDNAQQDLLISESKSAKVTDFYVFLRAGDYAERDAEIRTFITKATDASIIVWGLEGYRGYFSDSLGPSALIAAADALIAFNSRGVSSEAFAGFHTDLEPQDGQGDFPATFHNDIADSKLNTAAGGVWKASEAEDRDALLQDWVNTETLLKTKLQSVGLRLGIDMPSWVDDYNGEPVKVTFNGQKQGLLEVMMGIADDYIVMSYSTEPDYVIAKVLGELNYADTIPSAARPRIFGGIETHAGVANTISYADTPGKTTRAAAAKDLHSEVMSLSSHPSFSGISIHDWVGWRDLAP